MVNGAIDLSCKRMGPQVQYGDWNICVFGKISNSKDPFLGVPNLIRN